MSLRVGRTPPGICPTTAPDGKGPPGERASQNFLGNGLLWTQLPTGAVFLVSQDRFGADGSVTEKLPWWARDADELRVRVRKANAASPSFGAEVIRGSSSGMFRGSSWVSRVLFPSVGCWKIEGRVGDVSLAVVVSVVQAS